MQPQVDVAQYCRYDFSVTIITDQAANKGRNAQLLVCGDKGVVCGLQTWGGPGSSDFVT